VLPTTQATSEVLALVATAITSVRADRTARSSVLPLVADDVSSPMTYVRAASRVSIA
jgi:hypothetical protein